MANEVFFLHRIRHYQKNGEWTWDKGIEVKDAEGVDNFEAAKQAYHAYLGAYAYGHDADTDYVACYITDLMGSRLMWEGWDKIPRVEPKPTPEPTPETVQE